MRNTKKNRAAIVRQSNAYEPGLLEDLKDLKFAADFLSNCIDGDDDREFEIFFSALEKIVKAQGIENVAERMDLKRDTLYKMFKHQNPTVKSLARLLSAVGLEMSVAVRKSGSALRRA